MPVEKKVLFSVKDSGKVFVDPKTGEREIKVLKITDGTTETTFRGYWCKRIPRYGETELSEQLAKPFISPKLPTHHHLPDVKKIGVVPDEDDVYVTYLTYETDEHGAEKDHDQRVTHPQFAQLLKQKGYITEKQWKTQVELATAAALKKTLVDQPTVQQTATK